MRWVIVAAVVLVCVFWLVAGVYSKSKDAPKKDETQGAGDNADDSGSG
jgi:hypothetical protein